MLVALIDQLENIRDFVVVIGAFVVITLLAFWRPPPVSYPQPWQRIGARILAAIALIAAGAFVAALLYGLSQMPM